LSRNAADELGLDESIIVAAGAADQVAGALGNGITQPGSMSSTIGTAGQIFSPLSSPSYDKLKRTNTFCHAVQNAQNKQNIWYALGANLSAGYCLKWLANIIGSIDYEAMSERARLVPVGSRGVIFLPYLFGDRTPHQDERARGMFFGLAGSVGADEMIRAVMEGVVYSLAESVEIVRTLGVTPESVVASGGGARSDLWRQIQADVYGVPVARSGTSEQACLGAAILASVGSGFYPDINAACGVMTRPMDDICEPDMNAHSVYMEEFTVYRELYDRNRDLFPRVARFS
jgi:xylulokinase